MRNILMTSDLSSRSDRAFDRAVQLSRQFKSGLHVLHVLENDLPPDVQDELLDNAEKTLTAQAVKAKQKVSKVAAARKGGKTGAGVVVAPGVPAQTILDQAAKLKADLIVTGAHKKDMLRDLFIKSTAEQVLRFSEKPLLIVKNPVRAEYKTIVVGMDFSDQAMRAAYLALTLFPKAQVHLVHAYTLPFRGLVKDADLMEYTLEQRREGMDKMLSLLGRKLGKNKTRALARVRVEMKTGDASSALHAVVRKSRADLVVVGTHGKSSLITGIVGSVARDMIHHAKPDVLVGH